MRTELVLRITEDAANEGRIFFNLRRHDNDVARLQIRHGLEAIE